MEAVKHLGYYELFYQGKTVGRLELSRWLPPRPEVAMLGEVSYELEIRDLICWMREIATGDVVWHAAWRQDLSSPIDFEFNDSQYSFYRDPWWGPWEIRDRHDRVCGSVYLKEYLLGTRYLIETPKDFPLALRLFLFWIARRSDDQTGSG